MSSLSQLLINYSAAPSKIKLAPQPSSITFYGQPTNIDSKMFFFIDLQFPVDISGHHLPFFILFKQPHSMVRKCRVIKFFIKILVQKMLESTRHMALQFFFFCSTYPVKQTGALWWFRFRILPSCLAFKDV
jgi:hypothetical protein